MLPGCGEVELKSTPVCREQVGSTPLPQPPEDTLWGRDGRLCSRSAGQLLFMTGPQGTADHWQSSLHPTHVLVGMVPGAAVSLDTFVSRW